MSDKLSSMRHAGKVNQDAIEHGFRLAIPGRSLKEVDEAMERWIRRAGCVPAFKGYQPEGYPLPFPATACISPNAVVVHGIPNDYVLQPGDLLTIDVGTEYNGYFVDAARSRVIPGKESKDAQKLVDATEAILYAQLSVVKNDCTFLQMIGASEAEAVKWGVQIMPQWGGHGIAEQIHMDPFIPSALERSPIRRKIEENRYAGQTLKTGQTICIEPVTTFGSCDIIIDEDQWTVRQAQGQLAAHSERCLLVTNDGYELLS